MHAYTQTHIHTSYIHRRPRVRRCVSASRHLCTRAGGPSTRSASCRYSYMCLSVQGTCNPSCVRMYTSKYRVCTRIYVQCMHAGSYLVSWTAPGACVTRVRTSNILLSESLFLFVCMCTYIDTDVCLYVCTCTCIVLHTDVFVCMYTRIHKDVCIYLCIRTYIRNLYVCIRHIRADTLVRRACMRVPSANLHAHAPSTSTYDACM
jgi:hypothetical protein